MKRNISTSYDDNILPKLSRTTNIINNSKDVGRPDDIITSLVGVQKETDTNNKFECNDSDRMLSLTERLEKSISVIPSKSANHKQQDIIQCENGVDDLIVEHSNCNNSLLGINLNGLQLLNESMLPANFIDFCEKNKIPTIHNCDNLFRFGMSPYFQINAGLVCNISWPFELQNIFINDPKIVIITNVQKSEMYESVHSIDSGRTKIEYNAELITTYQKELLYRTYSYLYGHEDSTLFNFIHVQGRAGCGKTYILSQLSKQRNNINIKYVTLSNILCNDVRQLYNIKTQTFCSFIMELFSFNDNIAFYRAKLLQEIMTHISPETIDNFDCSSFFQKKHRWRDLMYKHFIKCRPFIKPQLQIIFIDEYTLISASLLSLCINLIKSFSEASFVKTLLIIAGDSNQIEPLFVTACHTYDFIEKKASHVISFNKQMRVLDEEYNILLNNCLTKPKELIGSYLSEYFQHKNERLIDYRYPIELAIKAPISKNGDNLEALAIWMRNENVNMINLIFFSYTNIEVHYNNMTLATSIYRQLKRLNVENIEYYIQFHILRFYIFKRFHYRFPIKDNDKKIAALALIRFFPYKLLVTLKAKTGTEMLPRSSILYLIDWNSELVFMYSKTENSIYKISQMKFQMNLYRNFTVYGFPLQLHLADTAHSLQGQTIDRKICINSTMCSRRELYVMLSRVRISKNVHSVYIPS